MVTKLCHTKKPKAQQKPISERLAKNSMRFFFNPRFSCSAKTTLSKSLLGFSDLTGMPASQMRLFHLNFAFFQCRSPATNWVASPTGVPAQSKNASFSHYFY